MEAGQTSVAMKIVVFILFLFLLAPVLLVIPISFSGEQILSFPPASWSFRWYVALAHNSTMISAFTTSLMLGAIVTVLSLAAAIPAAYVIVRMRTKGSEFLVQSLYRTSSASNYRAWSCDPDRVRIGRLPRQFLGVGDRASGHHVALRVAGACDDVEQHSARMRRSGIDPGRAAFHGLPTGDTAR